MIFKGSLIMDEVCFGKNKGNFRGVCIRCNSKYTASDMTTLENALGGHVCDPFKNPVLDWIIGKIEIVRDK